MKKLFASFFLISLMTISGFALDFTISVDVRAEDERVKQAVEKFVIQELSAIKDVQIVEKGNWNIRIMVLRHKLEDQKTFTYSLSAVMSSQAKCSAIGVEQTKASSETCDRLEDFATYMGGEKNLQTMSKEFVSDFDANILEFMREPHIDKLAEEAID